MNLHQPKQLEVDASKTPLEQFKQPVFCFPRPGIDYVSSFEDEDEVMSDTSSQQHVDSMFAQDNEQQKTFLEKCFAFDWYLCNWRFVGSKYDQDEIYKAMNEIYYHVINVYKYWSALRNSTGVFSINSNNLQGFARSCDFINSQFKNNTLYLCISSANNMSFKNTNALIPTKGIMRHEFLELLVRIACEKYYKSGETLCESDAVKMMIEKNLKGNIELYSTSEWKYQRLASESVTVTFKQYNEIFKRIFLKYGVYPGGKSSGIKILLLENFIQVCRACNLLNDKVSIRELPIIFILSMRIQNNEVNYDRHVNMTQIEFMEAFSRICELANFPLPIFYSEELELPFRGNPFKKQTKTIQVIRVEGQDLDAKLESGIIRLFQVCPPKFQNYFVWPSTCPLFMYHEDIIEVQINQYQASKLPKSDQEQEDDVSLNALPKIVL